MEYRDQKFEGQRFVIDDCEFEGCTLLRCVLIFEGRRELVANNTSIHGCEWLFEGAARRTLELLTKLNTFPRMSEFNEATFDHMRRGRPPTPEELASYKAPATPLDSILRDIQRALDRRLPYLAIAVALSIPDVCSAMERTPPDTKAPHYMAWCNAYLIPHYGVLTANDCYRMRCGVLHQGHFGRPDTKYDRLFFTVTDNPAQGMVDEMFSQGNMGNPDKVLQLDARRFCANMIAAAQNWYQAKANDPHVQENMPNLVRLRRDGYPPHIVGMPCIA